MCTNILITYLLLQVQTEDDRLIEEKVRQKLHNQDFGGSVLQEAGQRKRKAYNNNSVLKQCLQFSF